MKFVFIVLAIAIALPMTSHAKKENAAPPVPYSGEYHNGSNVENPDSTYAGLGDYSDGCDARLDERGHEDNDPNSRGERF